MADKHSPLAQFEIKTLVPLDFGGIDASFTNSALMMVATVVVVSAFLILGMRRNALVPGRWQSIAELSYVFIANLVKDTVGSEGRNYFPFIFTVFMFVLFGNLLGMVPYSFTFTSHIVVTFTMAAVIFVGVTLIALAKHKMHFFSFFMPPGVPILMAPLLIPIEIISYLSRPISLSVRLFANMLAGHTLLKVFAGFIISLGVFGVAPWLFVVALTGLEIVIAFLQAFVFTILTCLYLNDALHLH
ncbi:MAG: F0F1 ATP synthase subunit A [Alphaproteobacteria bacterium]|nr:F0F1 ATP synthase subunit A [Magnetovibrio sp.]UTW50908.1 F0F1 ATP synthase subunit A [bacterium SCSIO 12827]HBC07431.1 F0F1 ATP synthase subunit A [Rhodospirillaceae bacterium]HBT42177.1 F0F1 ATP synthase subunit A [Rhodospirillaceae bacterium]HCS68566.1 F0F1 ATP synthase subunit A [Rhodospirillaceae bacterium]